ncbi:alanine/glycine:cation symporter family protein [Kytococcus schroeteri]|uniref:alanine/glycine:cation symporter family protein n=1 Tax=Kytococcus schroeteri TaxID=138300 RepID=UPI001142FFDB|nr:alanine/glycine:cation symporter family protein [Kytococcus schroeteri]
MESFLATANEWLWSQYMIFLILALGAGFSLFLLFPQLRRLPDMITALKEGGDSKRGLSPFQSFAIALGGRVGVGNIVGVATAIHFGGPGAVFWMWVTAFLGATVAIAESSLAQVWKREVNGEYRGGPAYYIEQGLGWKWLAVLYAIGTIFATTFTGPSIQSFSISDSNLAAFHVPMWVSGAVVAGLFCLVTFGGMHRLGRVTEMVVPFMAGAYILVGLAMMVLRAGDVPDMFGLIFRSAFGGEAMFGGMLGAVIMWGVKRAIYSSEVGTGSAAQASAAAEVSHPVKQGLAQGFSAYVDTLFVCTITALMILLTKSYNVADPDGKMIVEYMPGENPGANYTQAAIDSVFPGFGPAFVAVAMFFFAFTTLLSFGFYAETNVAYLLKEHRWQPVAIAVARVLLAVSIVLGSLRSSETAWAWADLGLGFYTWVNLIALVMLSPVVLKVFRDYDRQRKEGVDPVFNPRDIGIDNAPVWDDVLARHGRGPGATAGADAGSAGATPDRA